MKKKIIAEDWEKEELKRLLLEAMEPWNYKFIEFYGKNDNGLKMSMSIETFVENFINNFN